MAKSTNEELKINLVTVKQYAEMKKWTVGYVYQLLHAGKIEGVNIAGVQFIRKNTAVLSASQVKA